ncbi:methyltransferase family protein [Streptomyces roseifaciens]|uniref:methyltransferase family protein n=1 Tax=Streptomyces roseifaciens TaxID=1488406 RepID=UPI000717E936|nr:isoprenylcysteine carboxylmethyltransferase family protein [Streptomyces roseifaciens]
MPVLDHSALRMAGAALAALSTGVVFACQQAMGASWRLAPDPGEHPLLITTGPFRLVRNPILTTLAVMTGALALTVPNALALAGTAAVLIGNELQVRHVEEPYLMGIHGTAYQEYTARTGRFLPLLGRRK